MPVLLFPLALLKRQFEQFRQENPEMVDGVKARAAILKCIATDGYDRELA